MKGPLAFFFFSLFSVNVVCRSPAVINCREDQLYHSETRRCYDRSSKGPCGNGMTFLPLQTNTRIGSCGCNLDSNRALIFHPETNQCYPIYSRGPCEESRWIILKYNRIPACEVNPCRNPENLRNPSAPVIPFDGQCVSLKSKPTGSANCSGNRVVILHKGIEPRCVNLTGLELEPFAISPLPVNPCDEHLVYSIDGSCQPRVSFG